MLSKHQRIIHLYDLCPARRLADCIWPSPYAGLKEIVDCNYWPETSNNWVHSWTNDIAIEKWYLRSLSMLSLRHGRSVHYWQRTSDRQLLGFVAMQYEPRLGGGNNNNEIQPSLFNKPARVPCNHISSPKSWQNHSLLWMMTSPACLPVHLHLIFFPRPNGLLAQQKKSRWRHSTALRPDGGQGAI